MAVGTDLCNAKRQGSHLWALEISKQTGDLSMIGAIPNHRRSQPRRYRRIRRFSFVQDVCVVAAVACAWRVYINPSSPRAWSGNPVTGSSQLLLSSLLRPSSKRFNTESSWDRPPLSVQRIPSPFRKRTRNGEPSSTLNRSVALHGLKQELC